MREEWRAVIGFEGKYEVSNLGRVRGVDRVSVYVRPGVPAPITRFHRGKMLSPGTVKSGHQLVVLGRGQNRLVHRLVLDAFVGPRPEGMECCHGDDNPANNELENLRWDTRAANVADYRRNKGRHQNGWGATRHA